MSLILSIETGTDVCSVALSKNGELKSLRESSEGKDHAKNLATYISEILTEHDLEIADIDAIAVGMGPGSYTGLRIGVSVAKGLCYAENKPLIAISSLESLMSVALDDYDAGLTEIENIETAMFCPMIDARRMEVYSAIYDSKFNLVMDVGAFIIDDTSFAEWRKDREFVIFGNGAKKCKEVFSGNVQYINVQHSAQGLIKSAHRKFKNKEFEDIAYFEPFYLKDFVAKVSKKDVLKK
ncbi:MAG: tRNA (adenosine(37)-N6)-threonylcarbamoyltransferase complex dimerization subunit type 1 TsaB [Rikenellaceae bacterium]